MAQQSSIGTHKTTVRSTAIFDYYDSQGEHHQLRNAVVVRYHSTDVVAISGDDLTGYTVILNHGGWTTATTKTRMNQAMREYGLPISVYQKDFEWFVRLNGGTTTLFPVHAAKIRVDCHGIPTKIEDITV